jgi:hypothetical protein
MVEVCLIFWRIVLPPASRTRSKPSMKLGEAGGKVSLPPASAGFLLHSLSYLEDGGSAFFQNVRLSPNCTTYNPKN